MQGSHVDFRGIFHKTSGTIIQNEKARANACRVFPLSTPYMHTASTRNVKESDSGAEVMGEIFARLVCQSALQVFSLA